MPIVGISTLSRHSTLKFAELTSIALLERRYQITHYRRYHLISPLGSGTGSRLGSTRGLGLRGSIKVVEFGISSQREPCDAAARRAPRHRLSPLPSRLGVGDEVPASRLTDAGRCSRPSVVATWGTLCEEFQSIVAAAGIGSFFARLLRPGASRSGSRPGPGA